jgi:UDP-N-acetylmuramate dehydrogenase
MVFISEIKSFFNGKIAVSEPLSEHTSFRIGGPCDYYFEPSDKNDFVELIKYLERVQIPCFILGNGTNLLVNDDGLRGAVISLENSLNNLKYENGLIYGEAGTKLSKFVDFCIKNSKTGVEMLAGIPGSLGGALVMNASAYGGTISDHLIDVEVFFEGNIQRIKKKDIDFRYRYSSLNKMVILSASFELEDGEMELSAIKRKELLDYRKAAQPVHLPCAGCVFKNPPGHHAAVLVQEAELKGVKIGGAEVSDLHGNFIVNTNKATAKDVIDLIKHVRKTIKDKFNLDMDLEIKTIGFLKDPFLD